MNPHVLPNLGFRRGMSCNVDMDRAVFSERLLLDCMLAGKMSEMGI